MNIVCGVPQGSILGLLLFLIYFNDFKKCLQYSQALNFADDTVVYVTEKSKDMIKYQLKEDLKLISTYFQRNQLVINLKKGKTGTMLIGTAKRLTKCGKKLTLYYDGIQMQTARTYKYLGTTLDSTLSLSTSFKKMYKKTTAKLCMMYSLHSYLDQLSKIKIFCGMILPCITYNCTVNMDLNLTQIKKLQTIDIFTTNVTGTRQPSVENEIKKRLIILVQKCVEKDTCKNFKDYF